MLKRIFDIVFSLFGLIVLGPLLLIVAAIIKITSPGPVFFRGERISRNGRRFKIFKFRSMLVGSDTYGAKNIGQNDNRVTPIGKIMRATKLDELPQLISVLIGDMSFVGPRPELDVYVAMYTEEEKAILTLQPGITDWASIVHSRQHVNFTNSDDPDKTYLEQIRPLKLKLQMLYLRKHNVGIDFLIILLTIGKLFTKKTWLPKDVREIVEQFENRHQLPAGASPQGATP